MSVILLDAPTLAARQSDKWNRAHLDIVTFWLYSPYILRLHVHKREFYAPGRFYRFVISLEGGDEGKSENETEQKEVKRKFKLNSPE